MSDNPAPYRQTELLDPARATALFATLGQDRGIAAGDKLPPFFHHVYFWDAQTPQNLGRDGHPRVGQGLIPDLGLPRRMWAGGRLMFYQPLVAGRVTEKRSVLASTKRTTGRSGPLAFVTLAHEYFQKDELCLREEQDLVYREDPTPGTHPKDPPLAPAKGEEQKSVAFDSTSLFRYSALTFNGHRIHYDLEYAQSVEGYAGLVVHGPLLAQLLMLWLTEMKGALTAFEFRATSPLMPQETAVLCCDGGDAWVAGPEGRMCVTAKFATE